MLTDEYETGEPVPVELCPDIDENAELRFGVSVEVYDGYGTTKHVYPTTQLESVDEMLSADSDVDALATFGDDVRVYTVPHDDLR